MSTIWMPDYGLDYRVNPARATVGQYALNPRNHNLTIDFVAFANKSQKSWTVIRRSYRHVYSMPRYVKNRATRFSATCSR
jgi:hypothetical protein